MKYILKFLAFLTLRSTLVNLSKSDTVHYKKTLGQMDKTRSAMIVLSGTSEELVNSIHELINQKSGLESLVQSLKEQKEFLDNEIKRAKEEQYDLVNEILDHAEDTFGM